MAQNLYVEAPAVQPLPYGLLSAAVVIDETDPHFALGVMYEPDYCGPSFATPGACQPEDFGTISLTAGTTRNATLHVAGNPTGAYSIDWGDGTVVADSTPDAATHTYSADGAKTVTLTGPNGYVGQTTATITNGVALSSTPGTVEHQNAPVDGINLIQGVPFTVYHLLQCRAVGVENRIAQRARTGLAGGESRAVETVQAYQMATNTDAVDLTPTPGTAVHPVDGLGILEEWAASNYGGVPVIHSPRGLTTRLHSYHAVTRNDRGTPTLETAQGSRVASGGGYAGIQGPGATAAGTDQTWLYVTGTVMAIRSSVIEVRPQIATNPATNQVQALALRNYVLTTECITGAVLVTTPFKVPA